VHLEIKEIKDHPAHQEIGENLVQMEGKVLQEVLAHPEIL